MSMDEKKNTLDRRNFVLHPLSNPQPYMNYNPSEENMQIRPEVKCERQNRYLLVVDLNCHDSIQTVNYLLPRIL